MTTPRAQNKGHFLATVWCNQKQLVIHVKSDDHTKSRMVGLHHQLKIAPYVAIVIPLTLRGCYGTNSMLHHKLL